WPVGGNGGFVSGYSTWHSGGTHRGAGADYGANWSAVKYGTWRQWSQCDDGGGGSGDQFSQPGVTRRQYIGNGAGRLSFCRLFKSRRAVKPAAVCYYHGLIAAILAANGALAATAVTTYFLIRCLCE